MAAWIWPLVVAGVLVLFLIGIIIWLYATRRKFGVTLSKHRYPIFSYNLWWIVTLGLLAWAFWKVPEVRGTIPSELIPTPVGMIWFGALGGAAYSLKGVYDHRNDWDNTWDIWHLGRPLSGAVTGAVMYVLLRAINADQSPSEFIGYAAAFILGTQEKRFFQFISEVGRLVVHVPRDDADGDLVVDKIEPREGAAGTVITVQGKNFNEYARVTVDGKPLDNATMRQSVNGMEITGAVPAGVRNGPADVDMVVANPDGSARVVAFKIV